MHFFHHPADKEKVSFLMKLAVQLKQEGEVLMDDVPFCAGILCIERG